MLDREQYTQMVDQIGRGNLMAISGGRVELLSNGIELPVGRGYRVIVQLDPSSDTYVVTREYHKRVRGVQSVYRHGQRREVYADQLGETAYVASCFSSYDKDEWVSEAASRA